MARVAAAIASNGTLRDVRVEKTASPRSIPTHDLVSPDAAATLGRYLRDAVLTGTGRSLREHPWRIAGKTGTAEVHGAPSHAWFVGYAPYVNRVPQREGLQRIDLCVDRLARVGALALRGAEVADPGVEAAVVGQAPQQAAVEEVG